MFNYITTIYNTILTYFKRWFATPSQEQVFARALKKLSTLDEANKTYLLWLKDNRTLDSIKDIRIVEHIECVYADYFFTELHLPNPYPLPNTIY
jgi:hypothetical protein